MKNLLTTREAAELLDVDYPNQALALLHAADVEHRRLAGSRGAYLWDAEAVRGLRQIFQKEHGTASEKTGDRDGSYEPSNHP